MDFTFIGLVLDTRSATTGLGCITIAEVFISDPVQCDSYFYVRTVYKTIFKLKVYFISTILASKVE